MSTSSSPIDQALALGKLVPGFDFLQGLVKNAGAALPNIGSWVAPTLNPEELEKRIDELRTVQFWLEQNARMLAATIQALEVQRMTLSTLQGMNVPVDMLRESLTLRTPAAPTPATPPPAATAPAPSRSSARKGTSSKRKTGDGLAAAGMLPPGAIDPMQWWGSLTKQFTQLATTAMKDAASDTAKNLASDLVKQGFNAAEQTLKAGLAPAKKAAEAAGNVVGAAARTAARTAARAKPAAPAPSKTAKTGKSTARSRKPAATGGGGD